ncbi:peroxide stress protein YaaA [Orbaceae bacterium ac157xtp]
MLILLSPSKTLDFSAPLLTQKYTQPILLEETKQLIPYCKALSANDLKQLMGISDKLAELNYERFQTWQPNFNLNNARQAISAFKGDVYEGLQAEDFTEDDLNFAQQKLRILSGLYGLLKPLDLIQPYRLEMGIKLKNGENNNLYQFWNNKITATLNNDLDADKTIVNLASNEYFKAVNSKKLPATIIHPVFLDESKNQYKVISFYAKKARGLMARFIIKNELNNVDDLKSFNLGGYQFDSKQSTDQQWVFKRSQQTAKQSND